MKKCPYCGSQMNEDSIFCSGCGKKFPEGNVCRYCGASIYEGDIYCENCGKKIDEDGIVSESEPIQQIASPREDTVNSDTHEEYEDKPSFIQQYKSYIIGILVLLALVGGSWYGYDAYSKYSAAKQAREKFVADSLEQVRKDSIKLAEQKEQARKDSIENARILSLQKPYLNLLDKYNVEDDNFGKLYFLYDITGDGLPEIWMNIKEGEDFKFCVYSCQHGESKLLFKDELGYNNSFYYGDNYVLMNYAHMGFQVINKFYLSNNVIKKKKIFETEEAESMFDVEYKEIEEPSITTYELTDKNPIYEIK